MKNKIFWIVGVLVLLGVGLFVGGVYVIEKGRGEEVACTDDMVQCPDGSFAPRGGPRCEPDCSPKVPARVNMDVRVAPIAHATMALYFGDTAVYVDPVGGLSAFSAQTPPHIILVTDIHGDHLSTSTIAEVMKEGTTLIVPKAVHEKLPPELAVRARVLANGEAVKIQGLEILAVPMYNLPEEKDSRHAKGRGNGYVVTSEQQRVYIAGDTAGTPEMRALTGIDVAFIPMNLPYTMSVEEAADAVLAFSPKQVYPYHYRTGEGFSDVEKFKSLVNVGNADIEVVLAKWY